MWEMAHWTPAVSLWTLASTTFVQGFGLGFVFIPATLVAFATLPAQLRTDASAFLSLIRNIGSAIGVSITTTILASSVQTAHADLAAHASLFNRGLAQNAAGMFLNPNLPFGLVNLNGMIERNAYVIAYANDFLFMFFTCVPVLLVIMLMRAPPKLVPGALPDIEVVD